MGVVACAFRLLGDGVEIAGRAPEAFFDLLVEFPLRHDPRWLRSRGWISVPVMGGLRKGHTEIRRRIAESVRGGPLFAIAFRFGWEWGIDAYEVRCDAGAVEEIAAKLSGSHWLLTDSGMSLLVLSSARDHFAVAASREDAERVVGVSAAEAIDRFDRVKEFRHRDFHGCEHTIVVETCRMLLERNSPAYTGVYARDEEEVTVSDLTGYAVWNEGCYEPIVNPPLIGGMHPQAFRDLLLAIPTRLHPDFMRERRWVAAPFDTNCSFEDDRKIRERFVERVRGESGYLYVFVLRPYGETHQPEYYRVEARQEMVGAVAEDMGCCDWFVTDANMTAMLHVDSDLDKYVVAGQRTDVERIIGCDVRKAIDDWSIDHINRTGSILALLGERFVSHYAELLDQADASGY